MKKLLLGGIALVSFSLVGCGGVDVVDYNDKLVDTQNKCYTADNEMMDAWDAENYGLVKTLHTTALELCKQAQTEIATMNGYNDDTSLRDAFNEEMKIEVAYLEKLSEIIAYWTYEDPTPEQEAAEDALWDELDALDDTLDAAYDNSATVQEAFAKKYGYELED